MLGISLLPLDLRSGGTMSADRIQVIVVGSSDIELLCCVKNIDLCIYWSLITMRKKSTSEVIKLSLNFETVRARLSSN